jgi:outer membrane protein with beta-barrel domain
MKGIHVTRRLPLLLGASTLVALSLGASNADAGRYRFSGGGSVRVHGNVSVGASFSRPSYGYSYGYRGGYRPYSSWGVRGHIYVGGGYYYPRYYYPRYYYYYQPVPSYYGCYNACGSSSYYPVEGASTAPGVAVAAPPAPPELPKLGIGLYAGGVRLSNSDVNESQEVGLLGRFRLTPGLLIEGELAKTEYANNARVDRRLGASLVYEIGAYNKLAPYVLGGLGVQQAQVDGDFTTTQNFAELGVGLRYAFSPNFHLLFDVRAGTRKSVSSDAPSGLNSSARVVSPPSPDSGDSEDYTRARLAAMLYF